MPRFAGREGRDRHEAAESLTPSRAGLGLGRAVPRRPVAAAISASELQPDMSPPKKAWTGIVGSVMASTTPAFLRKSSRAALSPLAKRRAARRQRIPRSMSRTPNSSSEYVRQLYVKGEPSTTDRFARAVVRPEGSVEISRGQAKRRPRNFARGNVRAPAGALERWPWTEYPFSNQQKIADCGRKAKAKQGKSNVRNPQLKIKVGKCVELDEEFRVSSFKFRGIGRATNS